MQKEKLSSLIFEHHIYNRLKSKFSTYGINGLETLIIQELIDHDLVDRVMAHTQPEKQFLFEVCIYGINIIISYIAYHAVCDIKLLDSCQ